MLEGRIQHRDAGTETTRKSGWGIYSYRFSVTGQEYADGIEVRAKNYANALKQARAWGRRAGFEVIGDKQGYEDQRRIFG